MELLTEKEMLLAFKIWEDLYSKKIRRNKLRRKRQSHPDKKRMGQLREARSSLLLSTQAIADRLGISRQAYSRLENSEERGNITLSSLVEAAESMNCELVYSIQPKKGMTFSEMTWKKLLPAAFKDWRLQSARPKGRAQALAYAAFFLLKNSESRRENGWSQRI